MFGIMCLEITHHPAFRGQIYMMDAASFVWGAACQQGTHLIISPTSGRFVVLTTFLAALALFTSYSASIVALLQSPSTSIKTVNDLLASPLKVSVQDAAYTRFYFMKSNDSVLRKVYKVKVAPAGEKGWIYDTTAGVERVRTELMAYQLEEKPAYKAISKTYTESEKCSLSEIHILTLPIATVTVEKNFPFKELYKIRYTHYLLIWLLSHLILMSYC